MEQATQTASLFSKIVTWIVTSLSGFAVYNIIVAILLQVVTALVAVLGISMFAAKIIVFAVLALAAIGAFFIAKFLFKHIAKFVNWVIATFQTKYAEAKAKRASNKEAAEVKKAAKQAAQDVEDLAEAAEAAAA